MHEPELSPHRQPWRGGRAVQCTSLENWRPKGLVGSNPTPSASKIRRESMATLALAGTMFEPTRFFEEKALRGFEPSVKMVSAQAGFAISARRPRIAEGDRRSIPRPPSGHRYRDGHPHRSEVAGFSFGRARRTYVMVRVRAIQRADKASFDLRILQRPCGIYSRYWLSQFLGIFTGRSRPGRSHAHDQRA